MVRAALQLRLATLTALPLLVGWVLGDRMRLHACHALGHVHMDFKQAWQDSTRCSLVDAVLRPCLDRHWTSQRPPHAHPHADLQALWRACHVLREWPAGTCVTHL